MFEDVELNAIHEENAQELIERLLNMVAQLSADLRDARAEIQWYRDDNNCLKGEQGKPKIKGNKPNGLIGPGRTKIIERRPIPAPGDSGFADDGTLSVLPGWAIQKVSTA